jgi:hypothetical protein
MFPKGARNEQILHLDDPARIVESYDSKMTYNLDGKTQIDSPEPETQFSRLQKLKSILDCVDIFSKTKLFDGIEDDLYETLESYIGDLLEAVSVGIIDLLTILSIPYACMILENDACKEIRDEIVIAAIRCGANFSKFKCVRDIFDSSNIFMLLLSIMFKNKVSISKQVPEAIGVMLQNGNKSLKIIGCQKDPYKFHPFLFFYLLKFVALQDSPKLWMDFRFMATKLCTNELIELNPCTISIDQSLASEYMRVFKVLNKGFFTDWRSV